MSVANTTNVAVQAIPDLGQRRAIAEIVIVVSLLLLSLWTDSRQVLPKPARLTITVAAIVTIVGVLIAQRPDKRTFGLAPESWLDGAVPLAVGTGLAAASLLLLGWGLGTLGSTPNLARWCRDNAHIDLLQQILLQVFLVPRLKVLLANESRGTSSIIAGRWGIGTVHLWAGGIFGLLHVPNWPLLLLTTPAGVLWAAWFDRYRNLPAVWLSHFILATAVLYALDGPHLAHLRVGIGYLTATR